MTTCSYLSGSSILACKANLRLYVPSLAELDGYCTNGRHDFCPVYHRSAPGPSESDPPRLKKDVVSRQKR